MPTRIAVLAVATLALLGGPLGMARVHAGEPAADLTAMTNADRAAARVRALSTSGDLQSLAQERAGEMARAGRIYHTQGLGSKVSGWQRLGENVGRGPELADIEVAFMNSDSHRENILDTGFTQLGVGAVFDGAEFFVAVIFREPTAATASGPPPAPRTTPTSGSAPAPKTAKAPARTPPRPPAPATTTTTAPPPAPPVQPVVAPPDPAPPAPAEVPPTEATEAAGPAETTTTTAPRPIFTEPDFLAENFAGPTLPVAGTSPLPVKNGSTGRLLVAGALALGACAGVGRAWSRVAQAARHGRPGRARQDH